MAAPASSSAKPGHDQPPCRRAVRRRPRRQAACRSRPGGRRHRLQARARPAGGHGAHGAQGRDDPSLLGHGAARRRRAAAGQSRCRSSLADARDLAGSDVVVIGYPAFDPAQSGRRPAGRLRRTLQRQAAAARRVCRAASRRRASASWCLPQPTTARRLAAIPARRYSTSAPARCSACISAAAITSSNYAVPAAALSRDDRVDRPPASTSPASRPAARPNGRGWWPRADAAETVGGSADRAALPAPRDRVGRVRRVATAGLRSRPRAAASSSTCRCASRSRSARPCRLTRRRRRHRAVGEGDLEAMREPDHDTDYSTRTGYDPGFLNDPAQRLPKLAVPMPKAGDRQGAREDPRRRHVLHYQNFSLAMHAERRLALFTASNVTEAPELKQAGAGQGLHPQRPVRPRRERPGALVHRPAPRRALQIARHLLHQGSQGVRQGPYRSPRRRRLGHVAMTS